MGTEAVKINSPASTKKSEPSPEAIRVIVADTQSIYRVGIRKILAVEDEIRVVAQAENLAQACAAAD